MRYQDSYGARHTVHREVAYIAVLIALLACHRNGRTTAAGDPPGRVARLGELAGDVSFERPGANQWVKATPNYTVSTGDRVYVGQNSHAELDFGQGVTRVGDGGDLTVTNLTDHFTQLGLAGGGLDASVYRWVPEDSIELDTPNGALMPQDAGAYRVWIDPTDNSTIVSVDRGTLLVTGPGVSQTLQAGQTVRLTGTNPIEISSLAGPAVASTVPAGFARWSSDRDRVYHLAQLAPATRYVNQDMPGWIDLVDNGRWVSTSSNGQVWCPSNVSSSWVPYRTGHWAWVDPWGWTWVDDASWGFTTTHYGRWMQISSNASCRWAWVPASTNVAPVYAPALVSFVEGVANLVGLSNVNAWFPLGPQEPYFPWYSYSDTYLREINLADLGTAIAIDRLINPANVDAIAYVNRPVALTVVPTTVVVSGDPVAPAVVRVPPGQLAKANGLRIALQPPGKPSERLLAGGPLAVQPPVAGRPRMLVHGAPGNALGNRVRAGRGAAPQREAGGEVAAPARPGRGMAARAPRETAPRPIVSRNAPPARRQAFVPQPSRGGKGRAAQRAQPSRPAPAQGAPARGAQPAPGGRGGGPPSGKPGGGGKSGGGKPGGKPGGGRGRDG